jgi:hypothetical protein
MYDLLVFRRLSSGDGAKLRQRRLREPPLVHPQARRSAGAAAH